MGGLTMTSRINELRDILNGLKELETELISVISSVEEDFGSSNLINVDKSLALSYIQNVKEQVWTIIGKISNYN